MDGNEELICCSVEGEVRGYLPTSKKEGTGFEDMVGDQEALSRLNQIKQSLLQELKNFDSNEQTMKVSGDERTSLSSKMGVIPAGTTIRTEFSVVLASENVAIGPHLVLSVQTSNDTLIKCVAVFAEGLFEGESYISHPPEETLGAEVRIPFYPPKDVPQELHVKALVGYSDNDQFHVFEIHRPLPRFALYVPCASTTKPSPASYVEFQLTERVSRVRNWLTFGCTLTVGFCAIACIQSPNVHVYFQYYHDFDFKQSSHAVHRSMLLLHQWMLCLMGMILLQSCIITCYIRMSVFAHATFTPETLLLQVHPFHIQPLDWHV
jgi:Bardet-Biedl syndrome 2 protein